MYFELHPRIDSAWTTFRATMRDTGNPTKPAKSVTMAENKKFGPVRKNVMNAR